MASALSAAMLLLALATSPVATSPVATSPVATAPAAAVAGDEYERAGYRNASGTSEVLKEGDLRVLLRQVTNRDEGVGAVGERQAQHAGARAECGERLLWPQDREQARALRGHHRRPRLDIAVGVGKERRAFILGGAFR